jgi:hypothetical protein
MTDTTKQFQEVKKVFTRLTAANPHAREYVPSALRNLSIEVVLRDHHDWSQSEIERAYDEVTCMLDDANERCDTLDAATNKVDTKP